MGWKYMPLMRGTGSVADRTGFFCRQLVLKIKTDGSRYQLYAEERHPNKTAFQINEHFEYYGAY